MQLLNFKVIFCTSKSNTSPLSNWPSFILVKKLFWVQMSVLKLTSASASITLHYKATDTKHGTLTDEQISTQTLRNYKSLEISFLIDLLVIKKKHCITNKSVGSLQFLVNVSLNLRVQHYNKVSCPGSEVLQCSHTSDQSTTNPLFKISWFSQVFHDRGNPVLCLQKSRLITLDGHISQWLILQGSLFLCSVFMGVFVSLTFFYVGHRLHGQVLLSWWWPEPGSDQCLVTAIIKKKVKKKKKPLSSFSRTTRTTKPPAY